MWRRSIGPAEPDDGPRSGGGRSGEGIAALVRSTPGSITYVEFAYATNNGLTYAAIQNRDGQFVSPSVNSVIAAITNSAPQLRRDVRSPIVNAPGAGSYPISGLTYILLPQKGNDKAKRTALLRFLNWATTDGQRFARPLLYAPLPRSLVQKNQATLRSLR
jgi:phosphate transport system substrate-binding protein